MEHVCLDRKRKSEESAEGVVPVVVVVVGLLVNAGSAAEVSAD